MCASNCFTLSCSTAEDKHALMLSYSTAAERIGLTGTAAKQQRQPNMAPAGSRTAVASGPCQQPAFTRGNRKPALWLEPAHHGVVVVDAHKHVICAAHHPLRHWAEADRSAGRVGGCGAAAAATAHAARRLQAGWCQSTAAAMTACPHPACPVQGRAVLQPPLCGQRTPACAAQTWPCGPAGR